MTQSDYKNVWIFAQADQTFFSSKGDVPQGELEKLAEYLQINKPHATAYELLSAARPLADALGEKVCAVLVGNNVRCLADDLTAHGADIVYVCENEQLNHFDDTAYARVLADMIAQYKPNKFLFPATHMGRALAARTAVLAHTGLTADAAQLTVHTDGQLYATRPTYGGKLLATITCQTRPEMCTVRPLCYPPAPQQADHTGEVIDFPFDAKKYTPLTEILELKGKNSAGADIAEAEVIVAGGRGVGSKAGFDLLRRLAERLGGAVGATRPAVDNGWADASAQLGVTGKNVKPKLYIACGISGQLHHTAGIGPKSVIVAINKDPEAPIMKTAHYALTGDLFEVIPALLDALR